jgi:hypothetical protein
MKVSIRSLTRCRGSPAKQKEGLGPVGFESEIEPTKETTTDTSKSESRS